MDAQLIVHRATSGTVVIECDTDGYVIRVPDPTGPAELVDQVNLWNGLGGMLDHIDDHNGHGKYA